MQEIMGTDYRPNRIKKLISRIYQFIDNENLNEAQRSLDELKNEIGENDTEVVSATAALELERFFGE